MPTVQHADAQELVGTSVNGALCENSGNRILGHREGELPALVCFDEVSNTLTVRNQAPYWLKVRSAGALTFVSGDLSGVEGVETKALAYVMSTGGVVIAPGATHVYDVAFDGTTYAVQLLFSQEMYETEVHMQALVGLAGPFAGSFPLAAQAAAATANSVYDLGGADYSDLATDVLLDSLVGLQVLSAQEAVDLLILNQTVDQLARTSSALASSVAVTWPLSYGLSLAELLAQNLDYQNALSVFNIGTLVIAPRALAGPDPVEEWVTAPAPADRCAFELVPDHQEVFAAALSPSGTVAAVVFGDPESPILVTYNTADGTRRGSRRVGSTVAEPFGSLTSTRPLAVSDYGHVAMSRGDRVWVSDSKLSGWIPLVDSAPPDGARSNDATTAFDASGVLYVSTSGRVRGFPLGSRVQTYRYDLRSNDLAELSVGTPVSGDSRVLGVTPDGDRLLLATNAQDLPDIRPTWTGAGLPLVVADLSDGTFHEASINAGARSESDLTASISDDGQRVQWSKFADGSLFRFIGDVGATSQRLPSDVEQSPATPLSPDGEAIVFAAEAVEGERGDSSQQVFVHDVEAGTREVVGPRHPRELRYPVSGAARTPAGIDLTLVSKLATFGLDVVSLNASSCDREPARDSLWGELQSQTATPVDLELDDYREPNSNGAYRPWELVDEVIWPRSIREPVTLVGSEPAYLYHEWGTSSVSAELRRVPVELESCGETCVSVNVAGPNETIIGLGRRGRAAVPNPDEIIVARDGLSFPPRSSAGSAIANSTIVRIDALSGLVTQFAAPVHMPTGPLSVGTPKWDVDNSGRYVITSTRSGAPIVFDTLTNRHTSLDDATGMDLGEPTEVAFAAGGEAHTVAFRLAGTETDLAIRSTLALPPGAEPPDGEPPAEPLVGDINGDGVVRIAIVGDSYISGEGAAPNFPYRLGTDTPDTGVRFGEVEEGNRCHQAESSWAYLVSADLASASPEFNDNPTLDDHPNIGFFACSGAVAQNIWEIQQYVDEGSTQLERLSAFNHAHPVDLVLVSIGGNDAGFVDLIESCLFIRCERDAALARVRLLRGEVEHALKLVRSRLPAAQVIHMGYPQPLIPTEGCADFSPEDLDDVLKLVTGDWLGVRNSLLGVADVTIGELEWLTEEFQPALADQLKIAASRAGVAHIDPTNWLLERALCTGAASPYFNALEPGNDLPEQLEQDLRFFGKESYHPTVAGHQQWASRAREEIVDRLVPPSPLPTDISVPPPAPEAILEEADGTYNWSSNVAVSIRNAQPGGTVDAILTTTPLNIGSIDLDERGSADTQLSIPFGVQPGLHRLTLTERESGTTLTQKLLLVDGIAECNAPATGEPDSDGDSVADRCDPIPFDGPDADADRDGVPNASDNCTLVANPDQTDTDADEVGDACEFATGYTHADVAEIIEDSPDIDDDGVVNADDNCPVDANLGQIDTDADRAGDACDVDDDNDGVADDLDADPLDPLVGQTGELHRAVSCLAGNGRVDTTIVNPTDSPARYRLQFEGLTAREVTVGPGDWGRMPITGRPDKDYSVETYRDGDLISSEVVTVACDADRNTTGPATNPIVACRNDRGYILVELLNNSDTSKPYVLLFDRVPNRSTTAAPFGATVRAITGRPDGNYTLRVRSQGRIIEELPVTVNCTRPAH